MSFKCNANELVLTAPTAGAIWSGCRDISWSVSGDWTDKAIVLEFSHDNTVWYPITGSLKASILSYTWNTSVITDLFGDGLDSCRIRARTDDNSCIGQSGSFTIKNYSPDAPGITMLSPASGQSVKGIQEITWIADGNWSGNHIKITYTTDGANWLTLADGLSPLAGSCEWDTRKYGNSSWKMLKVADKTGATAAAAANLAINISEDIILISPSTGEIWSETENIRWKTIGNWRGKTIRIDCSPDEGANWYAIATGLDPASGEYLWNSADATGQYGNCSTYRIRVQDNFQSIAASTGNMTIDNSGNGTRCFDMGFVDFGYAHSSAAKAFCTNYVKTHGDFVGVWEDDGLPWVEALARDPLPQSFLDAWNTAKAGIDRSQAVFYAINPGRDGKMHGYWGANGAEPLPSPWDTYKFDSPDVIAAFEYIIDKAVEFFNPKYIGLGIEVGNHYIEGGVSVWNEYMRFQKAVYEYIKARYPDISIVGSAVSELFEDPGYELLLAGFYNYNDAWGISSYPYMPTHKSILEYTSSGLFYPSDFYHRMTGMAAKYGKKVAICEEAYIHSDLILDRYKMNIKSSEDLQDYDRMRVLKDMNEAGALFVCGTYPFDLKDYWANEEDLFTKDIFMLWRDIGHIRHDNPGFTRFKAESTWDGWLVKRKHSSERTAAPGNVTGFSATKDRSGHITLKWTMPADAAAVRILRKNGSYSTGVDDGAAIYMGTETSFTDYEASPARDWYYSAWARDSCFNWSDGEYAGARAIGYAYQDTTPPCGITNFAASTGQSHNIELTWNDPKDADFAGTKLLRRTERYPASVTDGTTVFYGIASGKKTKIYNDKVEPGITYYYAAFARDREGNWSCGTKACGSAGEMLFSEGFEADFSQWDSQGWSRTETQKSEGRYSACLKSGAACLTSRNIDTTGCFAVKVSLRFRKHGIENADGIFLQLYDGTGYNTVYQFGDECYDDTWVYYEYLASDGKYARADFKIRITGAPGRNEAALWVDDVHVHKR